MFWAQASSAIRFEESYGKVAQQAQISGWADPKADVLSMVHAWLSDKHNGRWTMVVDNADSYEVMFGSRSGEARTSTVFSTSPSAMASSDRSLSNYLPSSAQGAIVITTRSREVAKGLIEYAEDIVDVVPMTSEDVLVLLSRRFEKPFACYKSWITCHWPSPRQQRISISSGPE